MNNIEAIKNRKSVRKYNDTIIDDKKKEILVNLINKYNKEGNISIEFLEDGSKAFNNILKTYGTFGKVRSLIILKGNVNDEYLDEKLGYYGELLVLEATKLELGTCFVGTSFNKKKILINDNERLVLVITIGNYNDDKKKKNKNPITYFYTSDTDIPDWLLKGIEAIQMAPSAMNKQPIRIEYKDSNIKIYTTSNDKYSNVDLGIAKANFVYAIGGSFELGNNAKYKK